MQQRVVDGAGISISALCLLHCLAMPFAAAALPSLAVFGGAEWVHWALLAAALPITLLALAPRHHSAPAPAIAILSAAFGLALMAAGALEFPSHAWGEGLTLAGVLAVALAHTLNWRARHDAAQAEVRRACDCPLHT